MKSKTSNHVYAQVDDWVARWLSPQKMVPLYGNEHFKKLLEQYLEVIPSNLSSSFEKLLQNIHKMPTDLQSKVWQGIFTRMKNKPEMFDKLSKK